MWPIKWLEISPGMWILSQNFETDISLRSICKYIQKLIFFNNFCKNFQGKFFFKGLHQFSTKNCTYSYKSLPLRIFFNSYLVKTHCAMLHIVLINVFESFTYHDNNEKWSWNKRDRIPPLLPLTSSSKFSRNVLSFLFLDSRSDNFAPSRFSRV